MKGIGMTILGFLFGLKFKKILINNLSKQKKEDYDEYQKALMNLKKEQDKIPEIVARGEKVMKELELEKQEQEKRLAKIFQMRYGKN
jgi:hypothetical protein